MSSALSVQPISAGAAYLAAGRSGERRAPERRRGGGEQSPPAFFLPLSPPEAQRRRRQRAPRLPHTQVRGERSKKKKKKSQNCKKHHNKGRGRLPSIRPRGHAAAGSVHSALPFLETATTAPAPPELSATRTAHSAVGGRGRGRARARGGGRGGSECACVQHRAAGGRERNAGEKLSLSCVCVTSAHGSAHLATDGRADGGGLLRARI